MASIIIAQDELIVLESLRSAIHNKSVNILRISEIYEIENGGVLTEVWSNSVHNAFKFIVEINK